MRIGLFAAVLAAALLAIAPGAASSETKPVGAKQMGADAALAAINAMSEDEMWEMDGRDVADRIFAQSSVDSLRAAAAQGDARAQWIWGHVQYFGVGGVPANPDAAAALWLAGAQAGNPRAQNDIAWMYEHGQGVALDMAAAARWYRAAANQNHGGAQSELGKMYEEGRGVAQDYAEARRLYLAAAENGYAFYRLGYLYEMGLGVTSDLAVARSWYQRAADQGDEDARQRLMALGN
jgi:TPR repeat protein